MGERTGEIVARRSARVWSWPESHLAHIAQAVAGMAAAVAVSFWYWAAGGSFGLSSAQPNMSRAMQASAVAGAVIAAVGLLGLAGRWGRRARFWLPAALTWVGSSALAAFDGLTLLLNRLFVMFGAASAPGWSLTDTVVVIKVVVGVLAAAVGALAVTAAAKEDQRAAALHSETFG